VTTDRKLTEELDKELDKELAMDKTSRVENRLVVNNNTRMGRTDWKPNSINYMLTMRLTCGELVDQSLKGYWNELRTRGWRFYVVDQGAGRCYYGHRVITIPLRVIPEKTAKIGYFTYYLAHEMAHVFAGHGAKHGQVFMDWLKKICPKEYWHYELEYKARNAAHAGIDYSQTIFTDKELF